MITIEVSQKGALVVVDGKEVGRSPLADDVFVEPGAHAIEAKLAEFTDAKQTVEAAKGSAQMVRLSLSKVRPVPTATASAGPTAAASTTASAGPLVLPPKDDPRARTRKAIIIGGASAAGAALIAGVVFTGIANGKAGDANKLAQPLAEDACAPSPPAVGCDTLRRTRDVQYTFATAALWSFVGAGTLGAATVIYALATPRAGKPTAVWVTPVAATDRGALLVSGTW